MATLAERSGVMHRILLTLLSTFLAFAFIASASADARPRTVKFDLGYPAGSIIVINNERALYYVLGDGKAIRYPVAVGNRKELWTGRTFVSMKKKNPWWFPIGGGRPHRGGLPTNPLGKRALYLDWSLLRIHGTPSRGSIGSAVSNGCIRMLNEDVIHLYEKVHIGAPVIAVNRRAEAGRFLKPHVSGKLPAYTRRSTRRRSARARSRR